MENKEAIEFLRNIESSGAKANEITIACKMGADALEKQRPKTVTGKKKAIFCGDCNAYIGLKSECEMFPNEFAKYCLMCGQALKWGESDEA